MLEVFANVNQSFTKVNKKVDPSKPLTDVSLICPALLSRYWDASDEAKSILGVEFAIVEGYRTPERQEWLWGQGRTREGKIVTKARPYASLHNYGLAIDVIGVVGGRRTYDVAWDKITEIFKSHDLRSLAPFEQAHFELPIGMKTKELEKILISCGGSLQRLWSKLELI